MALHIHEASTGLLESGFLRNHDHCKDRPEKGHLREESQMGFRFDLWPCNYTEKPTGVAMLMSEMGFSMKRACAEQLLCHYCRRAALPRAVFYLCLTLGKWGGGE